MSARKALLAMALASMLAGCGTLSEGTSKVRVGLDGVKISRDAPATQPNPAAGDSIHALLQLYAPEAGAGRIDNALFCDRVEAMGYSRSHATWQRYCVETDAQPIETPPPACPEPTPCPAPAPCPQCAECADCDKGEELATIDALRTQLGKADDQLLLRENEARSFKDFKQAVCGTDLPVHLANGKAHIRKVFTGNDDMRLLAEQLAKADVINAIVNECARR